MKAQMRALKLGVETWLQSPVDARWSIVEWVTALASDLINRYLVASDSKTSHYRIFMRNFNGMAFECGEQIMAKPVSEGKGTKLDRHLKRKVSFKSNCTEGT